MKIAVVLAAAWIPGSVDMTQYLRQLQELGHETLMICQDRSEGPADFAVEAVDQTTLEDPAFYRRIKLDAAIAFTWFSNPKILLAMKQAGMRVLLRADSDGMISFRQFPSHHIRVRMSGEHGWLNRARAGKHLLQRYLFDYRKEDQDTLASIENADAVVLETQQAAKNIACFLDRQKRGDLKNRISVIPHFVADEFLTADIDPQREDAVVCIGRWEDPQKNARMLARAIATRIAVDPEAKTRYFIIGGERGRAEFSSLTRDYSQVTYTGAQTAAGVRLHLSKARVLLSASRWEGAPVVANEALAMGCTIVGPPIAAFVGICGDGRFGAVSPAHHFHALAGALSGEIARWDAGKRDPVGIASHWRPLLSSKGTVKKLVDLLTPTSALIHHPAENIHPAPQAAG